MNNCLFATAADTKRFEQSKVDNSRIMKIVVHDLRNPIGGIKMAASQISRKLGDQAGDFQMLDVTKKI